MADCSGTYVARDGRSGARFRAKLLAAIVLSAALSSAVVAEQTVNPQCFPRITQKSNTSVPADDPFSGEDLIFIAFKAGYKKHLTEESESAVPDAFVSVAAQNSVHRPCADPPECAVRAKITTPESIRPPPCPHPSQNESFRYTILSLHSSKNTRLTATRIIRHPGITKSDFYNSIAPSARVITTGG